jgi:hypothetical protein
MSCLSLVALVLEAWSILGTVRQYFPDFDNYIAKFTRELAAALHRRTAYDDKPMVG